MMKHKFLKTLVLSSLLTFTTITTSSCSAFFGESGYVIKDMNTIYNEQTGDTTIVITFSDDEIKPMSFVIPRGISGVDGVGIKNITTDIKTDEGGKENLVVIISYTDKELENTEFKIPLPKDGKGITTINTKKDEETNETIIEFEYTDGTTSGEIRIPKGEDGKQGVGIDAILVDDIDPLTNTIKVTILYSEPDWDPVELFIPVGVGIKSVEYDKSKSTDEEYALKITYSDDNPAIPHVDYIMLPVPQSTKWHSGISDPSEDIGKTGDYYINKKTGDAYQKLSSGWEFLFCMKGQGSAIRYTITFDANGGIFTDSPSIPVFAYRVNYGEYIDIDAFPSVSKEGYKFDGWYTSKEVNPNGGHFTDLTPVFKDMELYARWSAIN